MRQGEDDVITIDLLELGRLIWRNIWIVLIGIVAGAALAFLVTKIFITPKYQATSTIYILSKTTSITSLADLQIRISLELPSRNFRTASMRSAYVSAEIFPAHGASHF